MDICGLFTPVTTHWNIICDGCGEKDIVGKRYKCDECPDYDLCAGCYARNVHPGNHKFSNITQSTDWKQRIGVTQKPVPLIDSNISMRVVGSTVTAVMTQLYKNETKTPISALYKFPLDPRVALTSMLVSLEDGTIIEANLEEKEEAKKIYDAAVSKGDGAYLLERSIESKDVFSMNIASILPGSTCCVIINFVCEMKIESKEEYKLTVPSALLPRYQPPSSVSEPPCMVSVSGSISEAFFHPVKSIPCPDGINGCQVLHIDPLANSNAGNSNSNIKVTPTHKMKFEVRGTSLENEIISQVSSLSHRDINVQWLKNTWAAVGEIEPAKDIVLALRLAPSVKQELEVDISLETPTTLKDGSLLYPLALTITPNVDEHQLASNRRTDRDYVFVVDCSGSMDESIGGYDGEDHSLVDKTSKMEAAKEGMRIFLRSLQLDCNFNIIKFGSKHESLFTECKPYNDENFEAASKYIEKLDSNMGGTELRKVVKEFTDTVPLKPRTVFLLTDGEIADTQSVIKMATRGQHHTKYFTIGVGPSTSADLIDGLARATGGVSSSVTKVYELTKTITTQLKNAMGDYFENVMIWWQGVDIINNINDVSPPYLVPNQKNIFYYIFSAPSEFEGVVNVSMSSKTTGRILYSKGFSQRKIDTTVQSGSLLALAGRDAIERLEYKEKQTDNQELLKEYKQMIIKLSLLTKVMSLHTSLVAVETRNNQFVEKKPPQIYEIDHSVSKISMLSACSYQPLQKSGLIAQGACDMSGSEEEDEEFSFQEEAVMESSPFVTTKSTQSESLSSNGFQGGYVYESTPVSDTDAPTPVGKSLSELLKLQKWNGSWTLSDKLLESTGYKTVDDLKSEIQAMFGPMNPDLLTNDEFVTAFVIAILHSEWLAEKTTWNLIYEKASKFLESRSFTVQITSPAALSRFFKRND